MPVETKRSHAGLAEGLVAFAKMFADAATDFVQTQKYSHSYLECEENLWIGIVLSHPRAVKIHKDGTKTEHIQQEAFDPQSAKAVLRHLHSMLKLHHGSCRSFIEQRGLEGFQAMLSDLVPAWVAALDCDYIGLFTDFDGFHFCPVDRATFLTVQYFTSVMENAVPELKSAVLLFNGHVVYSGVEQPDLRALHSYVLSTGRFGETSVLKLAKPPFARPPVPHENEVFGSDYGRCIPLSTAEGFLTGPVRPDHSHSAIFVPTVFIGADLQPFKLVIYVQNQVTLLLLIDPEAELSLRWFLELRESSLRHHLASISMSIGEQFARIQSQEDPYRFIYFNHMNLAVKTSNRLKPYTLGPETIRTLNQIHADLANDTTHEAVVRTASEGWVVGRKSENREFYVIFDNPNFTLLKVEEEVAKFVQSYFSNIFIE
eukprot:GILK01009090.1.p1 GENE.GILK01009090.1~~GILK01009090.1.p1  ORF type:complete len:481 (+),score=62.82 GILK01009090.1:158-1444(+)